MKGGGPTRMIKANPRSNETISEMKRKKKKKNLE